MSFLAIIFGDSKSIEYVALIKLNTSLVASSNLNCFQFLYMKLIPISFMQCQKCRNFTQFPGVEICGKTQFPHSFERFAQNSAENLSFHKISTPGN